MPEEKKIQDFAKDLVNTTNRHIFLTGKAGTGKTTFLKSIIGSTYKETIVAAPTGIAAINAGGMTLHSLFQIPFGTFVPDNQFNYNPNSYPVANTPNSMLANQRMNKKRLKLLRSLELLIIDEVSMLRADILDAIDVILKKVKRTDTSFGGVQLLLIGDLLQLPPVIKREEYPILNNYYRSPYFFDALALANHPPLVIELDKIYRQNDPQFITLLNNLRHNTVTLSDSKLLANYYQEGFDADNEDGYVFLTTHNNSADAKNQKELDKLSGKKFKYLSKIDRDFPPSMYPMEPDLVLKEGAQVMFIKNDPSGESKFYNGKVGKVTKLEKEKVYVQCTDEDDVLEVDKFTWENASFKVDSKTDAIEQEVKGTFIQYPLKLAWAITVHKSQGLTFEKAIIDVERAFAPGQIYVALSRLTSLKGLVLSTQMPDRLPQTDQNLVAFLEKKALKKDLPQIVKDSSWEYFIHHGLYLFHFEDALGDLLGHLKTYTGEGGGSVRAKHHDWALALAGDFEKITSTGRKFGHQLLQIKATEDRKFLLERLEAAIKYFKPAFSAIQKTISEKIKDLKSDSRLTKYRAELKELEKSMGSQFLKVEKFEHLLISAIEGKPFIKKKSKPSSNNNGNSADITLGLYKLGKSIEEIAEEREMVSSTIEGHLAQKIAEGDLSVETFIQPDGLKEIIEYTNKQDSNALSPIKIHFGDKYSYGEIRMAMAHAKFLASK